ncbi:hypothetical protein BDR04DRAFT_1106090 [Suillus decipiens]|nr:hypothetical protein BDR04DRAFT_1106090 [Suillus decipiens]
MLSAQLPPARHANPPRQVPAARQPAAGAARNQPINLRRRVPAPVANIRPADPPQVPVAAPRLAPIVNILPTTRGAEVPAPAPPPVVQRTPALRREAPAPAPLPVVPRVTTLHHEEPAHPSQARRARRAEANARISTWFAGVPEPQPASTTATLDSNRNAVRQRMIMEAMERLRVDHNCDHTSWKFRSGGGRCESCAMRLPLLI